MNRKQEAEEHDPKKKKPAHHTGDVYELLAQLEHLALA
jgi:hypothetical protein